MSNYGNDQHDAECRAVQDLIYEGIELRKRGEEGAALRKYLEAVARADAALKRFPQSYFLHSFRAIAWYGIGNIAWNARKFEEAAVAYREAYDGEFEAFTLLMEEHRDQNLGQ